MRKQLLKTMLLVAVTLVGGASSAWCAGYTRTLTEALKVSGYKSKAFYDFQNNSPEVLPTSGDLRYRSYENGGYWGLHNFGANPRSGVATIPVANGDILIIQEYNSDYVTTINRGTENATLSSSTGYRVFDISSTADDVTFTVPRYGGIVAALVMEEDLTVATPTFTIGSYNYEQGGYTVTPSCATDGATLTYTIDGGAATACTSGTPFYAKNGKLNITASKAGWTSSSLASGNQWTLNVAPSTTSPETLIPFQKTNDNGDKNIEHVYKSVTIAGGGSSAIAGIVSGDANALKLRTNMNSNTVTLNVNSGYVVTRVSIEAKSNNKGTGATIGLTSTTVDGGSNIMAGTTTFPISTADAVMYDTDGTAINAKNNIVFTFDNSNIDPDDSNKKNYQIQATIKVWYKTPVENAIADCKTYETSSAFATAIDAESFASVNEVYAFHSAWQIAKANNSGSTDYSKAIMNRTFELHNTNGWTIYGDAATTELDENKYGDVEYGEGWSQYYTGYNGRNVSQTIASLPAGTYHLTAKVYSWSGGAPVRLFANGQLSAAENGDDHDPVLDFTVTGNEESIKIGIGGTGKNDNTDNTWGTWGYRVKNFTLTRAAVSGTITPAGWASFSSSYPLNLSTISGGTAYYASAASGSTVTLKETTATVPANEGLMIKGTPNATFTINVAASGTAIDGNLLKASDGSEVAASTDGAYHYVFGYKKPEEVVTEYGFYNLATATTVPAGKAYLETIEALTPAPNAPILFSIDDHEITGVKAIDNGQLTIDNYYNLAGQRVAQPTKGLYIVNGKKYVVK
jgi:hypothetical protein